MRVHAFLNLAFASTRSTALPRSSPPCGRPWTWQDHTHLRLVVRRPVAEPDPAD
jgi:hypothetical protein